MNLCLQNKRLYVLVYLNENINNTIGKLKEKQVNKIDILLILVA